MPSLPLSMKIQTSLQHGAGGVAVTKLCRHMSLFCREIEEAHFNPREANLKQKSVQMPLACLPWTWKNRNGWNWKWLGKNEAPFEGDTRTQSSWMPFVPLYYSASAADPLSFASFCAGPPQRFPIFVDRWWVPNPLWIGRLLTICFSIKGEGTGLVCSRMAAHGLPSLSIMGRSQDNAQPSRAAPWGPLARCTGWMKLALVHFRKVLSQIFLVCFFDQGRNRMKRNQREDTNLQKTRTKSTILPEHLRDNSHIRLDWVRARQSSKAQTLHM